MLNDITLYEIPGDATGSGASVTLYREVANRIARLALTNVTVGEIVKDLDTNTYHILTVLPASNASNWKYVIGIVSESVVTVTPVASVANINFFTTEVQNITLDLLAEVSNVTVNITPNLGFTQIITVLFGATAVNLNFVYAGIILQSGGGGATVLGVANQRMVITVLPNEDGSFLYISPVMYAL